MNKKPIIVTLCIIAAIVILILTETAEAATFCEGDALVENLTVNNETIIISNAGCNLGCLDSTLSTLGGPGCMEEDILLWIIILVIVVILALLFWGINR